MKGLKFGGAISRRVPIICGSLVALLALGGGTVAQAQTMNQIVGAIDELTLDDPTDQFSGGTITVAGQLMIIPKNLLIDVPAARMTLTELFDFAPGSCLGLASGLAAADICPDPNDVVVSTGTVLANRQLNGTVIVGDLFIDKGNGESITGIVTAIDYNEGFLTVNGSTKVKVNDPSGRHTIQPQNSAGCRPNIAGQANVPFPQGNCSGDSRFGLDADNYTITFITGYPACIPSTSQRFDSNGDPLAFTPSDANGQNDELCPHQNRDGSGVADDSRFFAPINVNDHISASGNFELIQGDRFFSAHTLTVNTKLTTKDSPDQPDYIVFDEVEWDVPGFQNERVRALLIGFTTLGNAQVEIFKLNFNSETGEYDESIFGSTVGCDLVNGVGTCTAQGIPPTGNGIFKLRYDVDFIQAALGERVPPRFSPCAQLTAAGFTAAETGCTAARTIEEEFQLMSPAPREIIGRSSHKGTLGFGVVTTDASGNEATNGEYLTPVGQGHPEFGEIDLGAIATAFIFEGQPWNLDRRAGPGGSDCDANGCETAAVGSFPLDPFPCSGLDPRYQVAGPGNMDRLLAYAPLALGGLMPLADIAAAQGCNLLAVVAPPNLPTPNPSEVPPEVVAAVVEVDRAQFEADKGEWRIDGVTDIPFEVITIYLGDHTVAGAQVIGQTTADDIGAYSVRAKDSAVSSNGGFVTAVSNNTGGFGIGSIRIK